MSWTRYLKHDFFTAREFNALDEARYRERERTIAREHEQGRATRRHDRRLDDLEGDLARMSLLVCALVELGIAKGAFTAEELEGLLDALDLRDGRRDGKLDPGWMRAAGKTTQDPD